MIGNLPLWQGVRSPGFRLVRVQGSRRVMSGLLPVQRVGGAGATTRRPKSSDMPPLAVGVWAQFGGGGDVGGVASDAPGRP